MSADQVRSLALQGCLVETNSLRLQLPAGIIAQLGLDLLKEASNR